MRPATRPITIVRGDTYQHLVTFTLADGVTAADLSGCTYAGAVRAAVNADDVLATMTATDGDDTGQVWFVIDAVDTAELVPGRRVYDLEETGADGNVTTFMGGPADVVGDVTR